MRGIDPPTFIPTLLVLLFLGGLSPREQTNLLGSLMRSPIIPTGQSESATLFSSKRGQEREISESALIGTDRRLHVVDEFLCKYPQLSGGLL